MAIDNVITLSKEVMKRNVDTGGRETLSERVSKLEYLKRHIIGRFDVGKLQRRETQGTGSIRLCSCCTRYLLRRRENRIGFLFTHKNGDFGLISVTE